VVKKRQVTGFHFFPHEIPRLVVADATPRLAGDFCEVVDAEDIGFGFDQPVAHGLGDGLDQRALGSGNGEVFRAELKALRGADVGFDGFEHVEFRAEVRGMVRASDQGSAGDVAEAFFQGDGFELIKHRRLDVFNDRQVFLGWAEVLTERENADVMGEQVVKGAEDFLTPLAQAEHDAAFGCDLAIDHRLGLFEDGETALVLGAGADERGESLDGFQVVVKNVWARVHDHGESPVAVVEIRNQDFDDDFRVCLSDGFDGEFEVLGSAVAEVVASDGGDDHVAKVHAARGLGDACGFVGFERVGLGGFHGAEPAGASAFITGDHEGGGALAPAFPAVWALGFFANRDQFQVRDQGFGGPESRIIWEADLDPGWFFVPVQGRIHLHFRPTAAHNGGKLDVRQPPGKRKVACFAWRGDSFKKAATVSRQISLISRGLRGARRCV
jgi:hypothetical protein